MNHLTKLSGSIIVASLLLSGCNSSSSESQSSSLSSNDAVVQNSVTNTKRNLQRELVAEEASLNRAASKATMANIIAAFVNDDLGDDEGTHLGSITSRTLLESMGLDVSGLSDEESDELLVEAYFQALAPAYGVEIQESAAAKERGLVSKFKDLLKKATDKVKDAIVDVVDDSKIVSKIAEESFKVMLQSGKVTKEMLRLAIKSETITDVMIAVMDDHWNLAAKMQPLLENDVDFGHLFMDLAVAHDYKMADFLFSRIDGPMYYSLTIAMTNSREDVGNGSAGKMTRVLSTLMAMPRMAKYFNVPSTLEYTDGQTVEAFSKLLFSNGTTARGDGNELSNERFFYEIFATPESTANFVTAMNNIDEETRLALMDQIFLGKSKFSSTEDSMQGYYNIYAIAGGMAYGLGIGAANYSAYEESLYGFADLVPSSRYYAYGVAFSKAGYSYYRDDNDAYISNFKGLIYGTMFDPEHYDYTKWLSFDDDGLKTETLVNRFYQFVLNREPDEEGAKVLTEALESEDHAVVAQNFVLAAAEETGAMSDEEFIKGLYVHGLKREPDSEGLSFWLDQLSSGAQNRGGVLLAFVNSDEAGGDSWWDELKNAYDEVDYSSWFDFDSTSLENETVVERFYSFVLSREPDEEGKKTWLAELESGKEVTQVAADFLEAAKAEMGEVDNTTFVTTLYTSGLGREPDEAGLKYWVDELDNGTNSRSNVLVAFIYSQEAGGDSWLDDISKYVGSSYEDAYSALGEYMDGIKTDVLGLFNDMSFDHLFKEDETRIQYFVSNSEEVKAQAKTYSGTEYTSTNLYASDERWAYIPQQYAEKDWIIQGDSEYLDMNFSFSGGYVTGYVVSELDYEAFSAAIPALSFVEEELNGDEPLSTKEDAIYHIYSTKLESGANIRLEWQALSASSAAVFFDSDDAIANASLIEEPKQ